ncbi:MAG: fibronectin type III domain-containing protein [Nitrosotalea sp.]
MVLFAPMISNQVVNAVTTSQLTVNTQDLNGVSISGIYIQLYSNGILVNSGYSPVTFTVNDTQMYSVVANNYLTYMFDHWLDTGSTSATRDISISSDSTITAVYKTTSSTVTVVPRPPTGLTATAVSSSQINLSWNAPTDNGGSAITGYKIERSNDTGTTWSTIVANTASTSTTYSDSGLSASTTYTYRVSAINSVGTSSPSNTASATTFTVPQPPTGLTATAASSSQINLSWTASNNGGSAITGYKIERSNDTGTTWSTVQSNTGTAGTTYSDTGLTASTAYTYRVSAINSVGTSLPSSTASATTQGAATAPQPPTGLTATAASSSQINLSWTTPANNGGSSVTGYEIERARGNLSFGSFSNSTDTLFFSRGNTTSFSDTGLAPSTAYNYTVFAKNSVGASKPSNTASATTFTVPQPPTGLTATAASSSQINLSWTASNNGGSAITGYMIERSNDTGATWSTVQSNTGTAGTTYSDTGLLQNTTYTYRVSAINSVGTSLPSSTASATTTTTQCVTCKLTVTTQLATGGSLTGIYVELDQNGQKISSGYAPVTFTLTSGIQYTVAVGNYNTYVFDHWLDTGSISNPRPISISNNTPITAVYKDTALTLSPSSGPAGTTVSATGTTFSSIHTITLTWDGSTLQTTPPMIISNLNGGFSATFQVPSASSGSHIVQATDGTNTHSTLFTVGGGSTIALNTNYVNVGTDVRITGTSFAPSSQITVSYDGTAIGVGSQDVGSGSTIPLTITTDSSGNFVAIMQVLRSVAGTHTISVQDASKNTASQPVTVLPHVVIFPTTGKPGSNVLIPASQGNGFAASSAVTIKFDGNIITPSGSITTDSEGNFGGNFTIPSTVASGNHTITISDTSSNTYSAAFTVDPNAHAFSSQVVASGANFPAYFAFIPDNGPGVDGSGAFMVNEKNTGNVDVFKNVNGQFVKQSVPFVTVPNLQVNYETNGLLGIAFDPNWTNSKMVYLYVTRNVTGSAAAAQGEVIRYHATTDSSGNIIADQSVGEQLVLGNIPAWNDGHNGGSLKFDSNGNLFISTGDGWKFTVSQNQTTLQGKILRITPLASPDSSGKLYSIPSTNPFASSTNTSIKKEIWVYGVRHPYTFDVDYKTGKVYLSDTGFNTWERIDNATAGGSNDGWPNYEAPPYGNPQNLASYVPQLYWYPHQGVEPQTGQGAGLEALSAGAFYHGTTYPNMDGAYFFGDYAVGNIVALLPSGMAPPTTDAASGYPIGQVQPILYGLTVSPIYMEEWNGKLYFLDLYGNISVLNYN